MMLTSLLLAALLTPSFLAPVPPGDTVLLDGLPRRAVLGASFTPPAAVGAEPVPLSDGASGGLVVSQVTGAGSFLTSDWQDGDILVGLGDHEIVGMAELGASLAEHRAGERVRVRRQRDGELQELEIELRARPLNGVADFRVEYGSVESEGALRRTMLTLPEGEGPHPAVLLIQGVGCFSLEQGLGLTVYGGFAEDLARRGFATLRVEKSGMGDSRGTPCMQIGFGTEVDGYRAGLAALKADPRVDPERVFLFGHSMGGIITALLAKDEPVAGYAVFGTGISHWIAYEINNLVDQSLMAGAAPELLDDYTRLRLKASYELMELKRTPEEIVADDPQLAGFLQSYPMSVKYFQDVYDIPKFATWKAADAPALVMWGTSDFVAKQRDHKILAQVLETWRPGSTTYLELEGVDHHAAAAPDMLTAMGLMQKPGGRPPAQAVLDALGDWLAELAGTDEG